jgi:hypothetical protein
LQTRQDIGQRPAPPSASDPRKAALETLRAAFSSLPPLFKERSHRHTFLALEEKVDRSDIDAVRAGRMPEDPQLLALSLLAKTLIEKRGRLTEGEEQRFLAAGFGRDHLLEVITIVAASSITNYTGNVTNLPLEPQFQRMRGAERHDDSATEARRKN